MSKRDDEAKVLKMLEELRSNFDERIKVWEKIMADAKTLQDKAIAGSYLGLAMHARDQTDLNTQLVKSQLTLQHDILSIHERLIDITKMIPNIDQAELEKLKKDVQDYMKNKPAIETWTKILEDAKKRASEEPSYFG